MIRDKPTTTSAAAAMSVLLLTATLSACRIGPAKIDPADSVVGRPTLSVAAVDEPLTLDSPHWLSLPNHALTLNALQIADDRRLYEPGSFQLARDDDALYLRIDFTDRDVVATAESDDDKLFQTGDVAEWFIGTPPTADGLPGSYYELHASPDGDRRAYRIDRPRLYEPMAEPPFTVEVQVRGTLNDPADRDAGWAVLFTLPWDAVAYLEGVPAAIDEPTRIPLTLLVGRYNYGHYLPYNENGAAGPELTMWPTQPNTAFHLRPHHGKICHGMND